MALKTWQKTALALTAISVFAGLGYTAYYFLYKKRKEEDGAEGEKKDEDPVKITASGKPEMQKMPTIDIPKKFVQQLQTKQS